ncbi:MAG: type II toxin-antitoxin system RelE/ParE family toxin [Singulisphaera sp.]|nr:type II toxin-antitoxin system RelE/ParE family toxin [Singulisphaera sp.]
MSTGERDPKPLVWLSGEVKTPPFSKGARIEAGALLRRLQEGESLGLPHSRPMPSIGPGCHELRIRDENRTWRIFYRLDGDAIVIAGMVPKTTQRTSKSDIDDCRRRLKRYDEVVRAATSRARKGRN